MRSWRPGKNTISSAFAIPRRVRRVVAVKKQNAKLLKKLLVISPHFPPINAADMHRVRQSLGYYKEFGWEPTVITVDPKYVEAKPDPLLEKTLPEGLLIISVKAFSTKYTRKVGLGSLALRSLYFYWRTVNKLLKEEHFDLVFF